MLFREQDSSSANQIVAHFAQRMLQSTGQAREEYYQLGRRQLSKEVGPDAPPLKQNTPQFNWAVKRLAESGRRQPLTPQK